MSGIRLQTDRRRAARGIPRFPRAVACSLKLHRQTGGQRHGPAQERHSGRGGAAAGAGAQVHLWALDRRQYRRAIRSATRRGPRSIPTTASASWPSSAPTASRSTTTTSSRSAPRLPSATQIVRRFKSTLDESGMVVVDGHDEPLRPSRLQGRRLHLQRPQVRRYAIAKTMRSIDLGAELGRQIYVFWGGREGVEAMAAKRPGRRAGSLSAKP